MKYDITRIKESLPPLSTLFERDGHPVRRSGTARFSCCPFHEERTPSCQVDDDTGRFHCFGCGAGGDAIDYLQKTWGTSLKDTLERLASSHGISPNPAARSAPKPAPAKKEDNTPVPMTGHQLAVWQEACDRLLRAEGEINRIAEWRGIDPDCVRWAASHGLMGSYQWWDSMREAFLVEMPSAAGPLPVSVHIRLAPGSKGHHGRDAKASWNFNPKKCGAWPFLIGNPSTAEYLFLMEGQWDALALVSVMGWHRRETWPPVAVIGLRGASSGSKLFAHNLNPKARLFAIADADGAGARWFEGEGLLDRLHPMVRDVVAFWPTEEKQDFNDLVKSGAVTRDILLHHLLPLMPLRKGRGPTFLQWCRERAGTLDAIGRAATYVVRDTARPKGRRPLRDWDRHWRKSRVPEDLYHDLSLAWASYIAARDHPERAPELPLVA
jgi:hypothetical protein